MTDSKTTTERLRELLDERGVKWESGDFIQPDAETQWGNNCYTDYSELPPYLAISNCTPEQAIAATLGDDDMYTRDDVENAFVSGYSLGSLPIGADPRWDENRQTVDEHMADLGWVRKADTESTTTDKDSADLGHVREMSATLGSGTLTAEQVMAIAGKHQPDYCSDTHVCFDWQAIADELNATLGSGECEPTEEYACSACGQDLVACDIGIGPNGGAIELDPPILFNFCPNCGRKVM